MEEINKAQTLLLVLANELVVQQESINNLREALDEYRVFLNKKIGELDK